MTMPRHQKPEEKYLLKKREELAALESQLADRELELHTLRGGMLRFEKQYEVMVGEKNVQLETLYQQIAERTPAASQEGPSENPAEAASASPPRRPRPAPKRGKPPAQAKSPAAAAVPPDFNPAESLKRLYRDVAKTMHPDLADSDEDRAHRHRFMIRANEAYEAANEQKLLTVVHDWEQSPESVKGDGPAADLVRVIRKIAWCERRLVEIATEIQQMQTSGLFGMKLMADEAAAFERDLLAEITGRLDAQIAEARQRLEQLGGPLPSAAPIDDPASQPEQRAERNPHG